MHPPQTIDIVRELEHALTCAQLSCGVAVLDHFGMSSMIPYFDTQVDDFVTLSPGFNDVVEGVRARTDSTHETLRQRWIIETRLTMRR